MIHYINKSFREHREIFVRKLTRLKTSTEWPFSFMLRPIIWLFIHVFVHKTKEADLTKCAQTTPG